jgi:hypothetical protein
MYSGAISGLAIDKLGDLYHAEDQVALADEVKLPSITKQCIPDTKVVAVKR